MDLLGWWSASVPAPTLFWISQGAIRTARVGQVNANSCDSRQTLETRGIPSPRHNMHTLDSKIHAPPVSGGSHPMVGAQTTNYGWNLASMNP